VKIIVTRSSGRGGKTDYHIGEGFLTGPETDSRKKIYPREKRKQKNISSILKRRNLVFKGLKEEDHPGILPQIRGLARFRKRPKETAVPSKRDVQGDIATIPLWEKKKETRAVFESQPTHGINPENHTTQAVNSTVGGEDARYSINARGRSPSVIRDVPKGP